MSVVGQTVLTRLDMARLYLSRKEDRDAYIQELMIETDPNPFRDEVHKLKLRVSELEDENKKLNQQVFDIQLGANTMKYDFENQTKLYTLQKKEMEVLKLKLTESEKVVRTDSEVCLNEKNKRKEMEEKLETEKSRLDKDRKIFEEKHKSLELNCAKLSKKISDLEVLLKREKEKNADKDFLTDKKFFEIEIRKLTKRLSGLSTDYMKGQKMRTDLKKKLELTVKERNILSAKVKELEALSSLHADVSTRNDFNSSNRIRPSNLFYNPYVDDSGHI